MKYNDVNDGKERCTAANNFKLRLSHCYQPPNVHRGSTNKLDVSNTKKISVAFPQVMRGYPGQFMIKRPDSGDSQAGLGAFQGRSFDVGSRYFMPSPRLSTANEWQKFSDKDYVMPSHVRDILLAEGVGCTTVEAWLQNREGRHKRARVLQQTDAYRTRIESRVKPLPPINNEKSLVANNQHIKENTTQPCPPGIELSDHQLTDETSIQDELNQSDAPQPLDVAQLNETEMKWQTEQLQERMLMQNTTRPRLVLISSKVTRCISMSRAVKREGHVLPIVYNFDSWSFSDIVGECQLRLDEYLRGCKAQSILIFCNGGPGYMYFLKNYVLTPQKIYQPKYHTAREFWQCLGQLISKLTPDNACIHVIGCQMKETKQGEMLKSCLEKVVEPNKVKLESLNEDDAEGRAKIGLYFNYRKYLLWRSRSEMTQLSLGTRLVGGYVGDSDDDTDE